MIEIDRVLHEQMRSFGANAYKKFLYSEVIYHWSELVDESISAQVKPVTIEHGVLFVNVKNSAFKDQLKFLTEEIIDAINEAFGEEEPLVKEIRPAKGFQIVNMPPPKLEPSPPEKSKITPEEITLTDEEVKRCEDYVTKYPDEEFRQMALDFLLRHTRAQKAELANGWHKCAKCGVLCPPEEIFCEVCKISEREAMVKELYRIFYDAPEIKTHEAQRVLLERMPHMRGECFPEAVESARTSLIQRIANQIREDDETSPDVLRLVALEKRLPLDKVTPAIVKRTLVDMQFNLPNRSLRRLYTTSRSPRR